MSQKLLHRGVFYTQKLLRAMATEIAVPKPDLGANTEKKDDFEALFRRKIKKKWIIAKFSLNNLTNHHHNLDATTPIRYNTVYQLIAANNNRTTHAARPRSNKP